MSVLISNVYAAARARFRTSLVIALATFVGVFGGAVTGFLGDLQTAIDAWGDGGEFVLPDPSVLSKAFFAAAAAALSGLADQVISGVRAAFGR